MNSTKDVHWSNTWRCAAHLLEDIGRDGRKASNRKAAELTQWLDGTKINPRFPTPLSKAAG